MTTLERYFSSVLYRISHILICNYLIIVLFLLLLMRVLDCPHQTHKNCGLIISANESISITNIYYP